MSASFRKHHNLLLALTIVLGASLAFPAFAEDRTAGKIPLSKKTAEIAAQKEAAKNAAEPEKDKQTEAAPAPQKEATVKKESKDVKEEKITEEKPPEEAQAEAPEERKPAPQADYSSIESIGLYKSEHEGSLGSNLWEGSSRALVTRMIKAIPLTESSPTLQALNRQLLLTAASTRDMKKDMPVAPGEDLFTLRLEKLLQVGAYEEALKMYQLNNDEAYDPLLARAGILAILYSGEKSLACLETRSMGTLGNDDFWQDFLAYCDVTLEQAPDNKAVDTLRTSKRRILLSLATNPNYQFIYTPKSFESLTMLEQAMLVAEGKLDLRGVSALGRDNIPSRDLPLLIAQKSLPERDKFILTLQAVKRGMMPSEAIYNMYETILKPGLGEDPKADPVRPATDWETLPYLYATAGHLPPGEEQWQAVSEAFSLASTFGDEALIPFASYISALKPNNLSLQDVRRAFTATEAAGGALPEYWIKALEQMEPTQVAEKKRYFQLMMANYIAEPIAHRTPEQLVRIQEYLNTQNSSFSYLAKTIIENLDIEPKDNDNAAGIYEKDFGLTSAGDYVMPSVDVWDRLYKASQNKNLGETVLLSAAALRGKTLQVIYPGVIRDVLNGLNTVGLNDVSRSLAIEAVLGN